MFRKWYTRASELLSTFIYVYVVLEYTQEVNRTYMYAHMFQSDCRTAAVVAGRDPRVRNKATELEKLF
jgi:hypothetical protein